MRDAWSAELFQLDASTCLALLGVHHVGRLIVPGDDPYVIPLNYTRPTAPSCFGRNADLSSKT